jgi:hypothetical protein
LSTEPNARRRLSVPAHQSCVLKNRRRFTYTAAYLFGALKSDKKDRKGGKKKEYQPRKHNKDRRFVVAFFQPRFRSRILPKRRKLGFPTFKNKLIAKTCENTTFTEF